MLHAVRWLPPAAAFRSIVTVHAVLLFTGSPLNVVEEKPQVLRHLFCIRGEESLDPTVAGDCMCGIITSHSSSSLPERNEIQIC